MAIEITWTRVAHLPTSQTGYRDGVASGISNIGGRLVMVAGSSFGRIFGDVYYSDDHGVTWTKGGGLAIFSDLGVGGYPPSDKSCGLLCYSPGIWLNPENGSGGIEFGFGDAGGILRSHEQDVGAGTPVFLNRGWSVFGRPCLVSRKDVAGRKFAIWPGEFLLDAFGVEPTGTPLIELTQGGATSLTTAFILHQLDPAGNPWAAGTYPDGSVMWLWVTTPPRVLSSDGTPEGAYNDGWGLFMVASHDGAIWRLHGPTQLTIDGRAQGFSSYNSFTDAFFLRDGTLLCGVNVSGLSPALFRSTDFGVTCHEIVLPGAFFNYVPQGQKGAYVFSGLFVMTHCFCELDDGTVLCGGGAPTSKTGAPVYGHPTGVESYHYPVMWKSEDKGLTWENISLNVGDFATTLPGDGTELWEARILLALGGQAALLICHIDAITGDDWTPFFITEDGGASFQKSMPPRVGLMAGDSGDITRPFFWPIQATYASDGSIVVVMTDWFENIEIWRGTLGEAVVDGHRAVGFMEQGDTESVSTSNFAIPEQELIRG